MKNKSLIIGIVSGILYGVIARLLFGSDAGYDSYETMSLAFLFGVPAVIGAITVYFGTEKQKASQLFRVCMPWVTVLAFLLTTLVTYLEATICVVMLLPAFMLSASLGGFIMGIFIDRWAKKQQTLNLFLVLPFLFAPIETRFISPTSINTVTSEIIINADKETVWNNIKSVDEIKDEELKWSFSHFIGIPKPIKSALAEESLGGIRHIKWEKGIRFREKITQWNPNESFSYDIIVDNIPPESIDKHVEIGGKYFDVLSGGYQLTEIDKNNTKLTLSCTYRITSKFNFYSEFWADFIMDDFQEVILQVIKGRSENSISVFKRYSSYSTPI